MIIKTVLWIRASILLLLGISILLSFRFNGHNEVETNAEKTVMKLILSLTSIILFSIGIANIGFSVFPKIETQEFELVGLSKKLFFETPCTFENDKEALLLTVPVSVAQKNLENLLTEGSHYIVTYETRSRVVVEIYEQTEQPL